uniref:Integrase, catalytic region, zinc finger, CCHC-type, peptidase aspartic, catalytic n=1 Tax=Tanacetum cinerariifolium TaxID=118510 RepID=A0A699HRM4_TANCI|nr:integrase, catalytic region, zinc finger, CCHC-type, peptidase aspartic, catalytic [Tanacetum cinerariifolium]
MLLAKQDEVGVTLTDEQNDFLFADASRMEEIKELSVNICLIARIQPTNFDSDAGPSYDSAFLSEVQTPSASYVNLLFAKDKQKQKYMKEPKIINNTIGDDQIDSNIIFDEPNKDVNSGSFEYGNNVQESYELKQLARNAYKEAEKQQIIAKKVQQQNTVLTKQLESYKEKGQIVDSGCSKHMTGDRSLLENFVEKFISTFCFGNDHFAAITGYVDYVQGNITVCHVYYVDGLRHNLFSVGQFCDDDSEVACAKKHDMCEI